MNVIFTPEATQQITTIADRGQHHRVMVALLTAIEEAPDFKSLPRAVFPFPSMAMIHWDSVCMLVVDIETHQVVISVTVA